MQNSANEDSTGVRPIKDDVPLVLNSAKSPADSIASATNFRGLRECTEASFQTIEIMEGLVDSPSVQGVISNIDQVETGQLRELIG